MTPREAYFLAEKNGHTEELKHVVLSDVVWSFLYASNIHKDNDLFEKCLEDSHMSLMWSRNIDKTPNDNARKSACKDPEWALMYALDVDGGPHEETRYGASVDDYWAMLYAVLVDKCQHPVTKEMIVGSEYQEEYFKLGEIGSEEKEKEK